MSKGISERKREAAASFASMFDGSKDKPTPEEIVVRVMHGVGGNEITDRQLDAAKFLIAYRLPKLATVEAHVATTEMSHEDWIKTLEIEDDE